MKLVRGLLACAVGIFTGLGLALPAQADVIWGSANPVIAAQTSIGKPAVEFSHVADCGSLTLTVDPNYFVKDSWQYGLKAEVNGEVKGHVLTTGAAGKASETFTFAEDEGGGSVEVTYYVYASTEWDAVPDELDYQKDWPNPGDKVRKVVVETDCKAPPTTEPPASESPEPSASATTLLNCTQIGRQVDKEDPLYRAELDSDGDGVACEAEDGQLAVTGADTTGIAAAGGALVLSGGVLLGWLYLQRRRREALQE